LPIDLAAFDANEALTSHSPPTIRRHIPTEVDAMNESLDAVAGRRTCGDDVRREGRLMPFDRRRTPGPTPSLLAVAAFVFGLAFSGLAQAPEESPEIQRHVATARQLADARYANGVERMCAPPESRSRPDFEDRTIEPVKLFDNVYFVGFKNVYAWAVDTPAGIVLLDALDTPEDADTTIAVGLTTLGLDPSRVSHVIVSHGHRDHYGGASYFQQRYGARVLASDKDWDLIAETEARRDPADRIRLTRDMSVSDGQVLTVGGTRFTLLITPGHTEGALTVIFPVTDQGRPHVVAVLNGPRVTSLETTRQMIASTQRIARAAQEAGVDVEFINHSYIDDSLPIIEATRNRTPGEAHPFVIGEEGFQRFAGWMIECLTAEALRRAN
jgi:metallo-beta-lactamase class B